MRPLIAVSIASAALLTGCGSSSSSGGKSSGSTTPVVAPASASGPQKVVIQNFKFAPATITVPRQTKITWTNEDAAPHTASATGLETGTLMKGQSKTLTLSKPGTYHYVCKFHPYMHGTLIVR